MVVVFHYSYKTQGPMESEIANSNVVRYDSVDYAVRYSFLLDGRTTHDDGNGFHFVLREKFVAGSNEFIIGVNLPKDSFIAQYMGHVSESKDRYLGPGNVLVSCKRTPTRQYPSCSHALHLLTLVVCRHSAKLDQRHQAKGASDACNARLGKSSSPGAVCDLRPAQGGAFLAQTGRPNI